MPDKFPMPDPQELWRKQPTEKFKMSSDQIRHKAQQQRLSARFRALFSILAGIILCAVFARSLASAGELLPRIGWGLLSLWSLYFAYQAYRWTWPPQLLFDATASVSLQFCRSELERRRDYGRHVWRRAGLTFLFLSLAIIAVPALIKALAAPRLFWNVAPLAVLLLIWLVAFLRIRKSQRQKLQEEIDELRALE